MNGRQRTALFIRGPLRHVRETGCYHTAIDQDARFFRLRRGRHAVHEKYVGSRNGSREEAVLRVVGVADVGGDGVVDYGAMGGHAEGVGGMVGVEGDGGLCRFC